MGRIIVTEFISIDGVMEAPGGGENFRHAGWTFRINRGKEGERFKLDEAMSSKALLLGRVTYEGFAKAWPSMKGEFADKFVSVRQTPPVTLCADSPQSLLKKGGDKCTTGSSGAGMLKRGGPVD